MAVAVKLRSLGPVKIFDGLSADELRDIADRCVWKMLPAKQTIMQIGDPSRDVYFVVSGRARVRIYSPGGRAVTYRDVEAGQYFGEFSAIDGRPRSASVEAISSCHVAVMTADTFISVLHKHPKVMFALLSDAVRLNRSLTERVFEFSTMTVRNRIQAELLRLAREDVAKGKWGRIDRLPTHAEMASRVSTHREAVTREMGDLEEAGIVRRLGSHSIECDIERLQRFVHEGSAT